MRDRIVTRGLTIDRPSLWVIVLAMLVAAGPLTPLSSAQLTPTPAASGYRGSNQESLYTGSFSDLAVAIDAFWGETLQAHGHPYRSPAVLPLEEVIDSACGTLFPEIGALYCTLDGSIYLNSAFLEAQQRTIGDYAPITILAHEWGHHLQALTNVPRPTTNQFELQADCLAGVYTQHAEAQGFLDPGDISEAVGVSGEFGDPLGLPQDQPGAHGINDDRIREFMRGYLNGLDACGLPLSEGPIRPTVVTEPAPRTPQSVTLPAQLPLVHSGCFRIEDDGTLTFDALVARLGGTRDASTRLRTWGWQQSVFRTFACDTPPEGQAGWIDISVHEFGDEASARQAVDYFTALRAEGTALVSAAPPAIGDQAAVLSGPASNGTEFTLYVSNGPRLIRVTGVSPTGIPFDDVLDVAQSLLSVASPSVQTPAPTPLTSADGVPPPADGAAALLPGSLSLGHAACFEAGDITVYEFPTLVERFPGIPDAAARLQDLGWQDGAFRQFTCDEPPSGRVDWIDLSVHRFKDAASAAAAGAFFASSRAVDTQLESVPVPAIGDSATAIAGPSDEGREYTLYVSSGPLLLRVTGVAPDGDPELDVQHVMQALYADVLLRSQQDHPTSTPLPPSVIPSPAPVPSSTPPEQEPPTREPTYGILDLGTGDGNWSSATLINDAGQVVLTTGMARDPMDRIVTDSLTMVWQDGVITDVIPRDAGIPVALNDTGTVLISDSGGGGDLLFLSASGVLRPLPGFETDAYPADINNAGLVVGQVGSDGVIADATSTQEIPPPAGFGFVGPAAINTAGDVVGTVRFSRTNESVQRAFLFADAVMTVLGPAPGAESSRAVDLNDQGLVLGGPGIFGMHSIPGAGHAFVYDRGKDTMTDIGTLPGYTTSAPGAMNNAGQVVGMAFAAEDPALPVRTPFLYDYQTGEMIDLNNLIHADSGWQLMDALDINDAGLIVGRGIREGEMHAFLLTPVN
jgi:probable HAF family extracellular repeat protein